MSDGGNNMKTEPTSVRSRCDPPTQGALVVSAASHSPGGALDQGGWTLSEIAEQGVTGLEFRPWA